jgi:transposase
MRVTTAFNRLLKLDGVNVTHVEIGTDTVTVEVRLRRRKLVCPVCGYTTKGRYDTRPVASSWRHLRLGTCKLVVAAQLRRLACPVHGVRVEAVPFARPSSRFTRDFSLSTPRQSA